MAFGRHPTANQPHVVVHLGMCRMAAAQAHDQINPRAGQGDFFQAFPDPGRNALVHGHDRRITIRP